MGDPNLFLAGFPKCGTTALSLLLKQHPDIFVPDVKEPRYFLFRDSPPKDTDIVNHNVYWVQEDYLRLYGAATQSFRLDASPGYATDKHALKAIQAVCPRAKIIILLRDPIERAYSHFLFAIQKGFEPADISFSDAISGRPRTKGRYVRDVDYIQGSKYSIHLENVFKYFDKENILILVHEELQEKPKKVLEKIEDFLNLPMSEYDYNIGTHAKSGLVKNKVLRLALDGAYSMRTYIPSYYVPNNLKRLIGYVKEKSLVKPELSDDIRDMLVGQFSSDVRYVKSLGVDVRTWKNFDNSLIY